MGVIENIKSKLDSVVKSGRNVEDLSTTDPEYKYIKDAKVVIDGRRLTTEEKFALAGYERPTKNKNLAEAIKCAILEYRENGGDFNVEYNKLPFIDDVRSYVNHYNAKNDVHITVEDCLRNFGAPEVSKIYKRYAQIMNVKHFADENGFVDAYRKDPQFYGYISKVSQSLDMIDAYVIELIGNQDVKQSYIDADYIKMVSQKVSDFIRLNKTEGGMANLNELHSKNPALYNQVNWVANNFCSLTGENVSRKDVLFLLGIESKDIIYDASERKTDKDFKEYISNLKNISSDNNGKLSRKDLTDRQYKIVKQKAQRLGVYLAELFRIYEIEYVGGIKRERFAKTKVEELPFIEDMRAERDSAYGIYLKQNEDKPKQIKFENYLYICTQVYKKYKDKILEKGLITQTELE